uniref:Pectinesterase inhibitor domain-containing protein n=1 Tax=Nelumbo nucifera TaxID=4432 RepID=A0A822XI00_NELNU|nr:TPA_asm: hypothetical protein HUJ06_021320 [Nelumbo nucifera]
MNSVVKMGLSFLVGDEVRMKRDMEEMDGLVVVRFYIMNTRPTSRDGSAVADLKSVLSDLSPKNSPSRHYNDLGTLLSAAMTNQYTYLDGFAHSKGNVREEIKQGLYNKSHSVSNSLAMLKKIPKSNRSSKAEVFPEFGRMVGGFPRWVSPRDRKLLQASTNTTKFDLVVACASWNR